MQVGEQVARKDFSRETLRALAARGVRPIGTTFVPGPGGSYSAGERAYVLDDRGTQRIRTFEEVKALAEQPLLIHAVNRVQGLLVAQFNELKSELWGFNSSLALWVTREGSRQWMEKGLEGLAAVCFDLAEEAKEMSGGGRIVAKASALAWMMMREA